MIKPIRDEQSYQEALARTEEIWGAEIGTPDGDELDVLMTLLEVCEARHFPMPPLTTCTLADIGDALAVQ